MKIILLLAGFLTLLSTTGCVVEDRGRHDRHYEHRDAVIVTPPVVVVP